MQKRKSPPHLLQAEIFKSNDKYKVCINAYWPTPNWQHASTHIDVDKINKNIIINYIGLEKRGISVMMIKEFTFELDLQFPSFGNWTILIKGKSGNITKLFKVKKAS